MSRKNIIIVRYFASLRERMGRNEDQLEVAGLSCVADVWSRVSNEAFPVNTLVAINQEYATPRSPVQAGDEVAFFPPVTGG
jgi:molybdopterin synthase sulfur carrier subunit